MRKDINKALTERPRGGHKQKHKDIRKKYNDSFNVRNVDEEDGPVGGTEGMRKPYDSWTIRKTNSDLWSVMRRFMLKQVGRQWNDVFSECCRDLKESDDMRAHFMAHVRIEVDEKLSIHPNGKLYRPRGPDTQMDWIDGNIPGCNKRFYVDPRDGILRKNVDRGVAYWRTSQYLARRELEHGRENGWVMPDGILIKYIDGIWYAVWYMEEKYKESVPVYGPYDRDLKREIIGYRLVDRSKFHTCKRQLNSRELKKYGATNDAR